MKIITPISDVHILNGDALKTQFPKSIEGEKIIARECLVDGNVTGNSLEELFANRSRFLVEVYNSPEDKYEKEVIPEFDKIQKLNNQNSVNLWFEDDLFCQVNLWFVCHLLSQFTNASEIHLIRPTSNIQFGFGGMNENDLELAYQQRIRIDKKNLKDLATLWKLYQHQDHKQIMTLAEQVKDEFPFLLPVIEANKDRFPVDGSFGRPQKTLLSIIEAFQTHDFELVFHEFCKREAIYGFSDMQVKRLISDLEN